MNKLQLFHVCIFFSTVVFGQEIQESKPVDAHPEKRLLQYRVLYPTGPEGNTYFNGAAEYKVSDNLSVRLENFYAKFGTHQQMTTSYLLKWYVKEKIYLFAGAESNLDINQYTGKQEIIRTSLRLGVGYEVKENLLLEAGLHSQVGGRTVDVFGEPVKGHNSLSLRARF